MKILPLVILCCCSIVVFSENKESSKEDLLSRASAQLERLAPYRRTFTEQKASDEQWQLLDNASKDASRILREQRTAFEIYKLLPENMQIDIAKRIGADRATIELLGDPKYIEMMQERIKRSGSKRDYSGPEEYDHPPDGYHYGGYDTDHGEHHESSGSDSGGILKGSGSLIGGIANGIIGGLVSASSSASKGSSSVSASSSSSSSSSSSDSGHKKPEYGHTYSYDDDSFGVWDIKKVIISTLMQAVKAISGGVIALKGQILKGSGYIVTTKGKMITKTGEAITTLGRNIVKNAAHRPQPEYHHHHSYLYEGGHDHEETYDGPPPSIEEFAEQNHDYHTSSNDESSSDVDDQAGLLIMKPMKPDGHNHHLLDTDFKKPSLTQPEENYHGPPPGVPEKHVENQENHLAMDSGHSDHPPSSYEVPIQHSLDDPTKIQAYPLYPPLNSGLNLNSPFSIQQSVEYPPIHVQYASPNKGINLPNVDTSSNDLSVYSSLSIDVDPKIQTVKLSPLKYENGLDLSKLQPNANFQSLPLLPNYPPFQEPLKIPLLKPLTPYWQNQGLLQPFGNLNVNPWYRRRSSAQRRRSVNEMHRMRQHHG